MQDVANKHQIKIARDSFNKNSCIGARLLGMPHADAYLILKTKTSDKVKPCQDCMESTKNAMEELYKHE